MKSASGSLLGQTLWQDTGIIGGGRITGSDIANSGALVCRNDDMDNFHYLPAGATKWKLFLRVGDNVSLAQGGHTSVGNWEICISHSNDQVMSARTNGYIWKTTDGGTIVTRTSVPRDATLSHSGANGNYRGMGNRMRFHPTNPLICVEYNTSGLLYTTDGWATWTLHPTVPTPAVPYGCVEWTPGGALYVLVPGSGVWSLPSGPTGSATLMSGSPTKGTRMRWGGSRLHVTGDYTTTDGPYLYWDGTTWTTVAGLTANSLAIKPSDPTKIIVAVEGGGPKAISTDSGTSFSTGFTATTVTTDVPWLGVTQHDYRTCSDIQWDPTADRCWFFDGVGVWKVDFPSFTPGAVNYTSVTLGIKELITKGVRCRPTDGRVAFTHEDRTVFAFDRAAVGLPALSHGTDMMVNLANGGAGLDWAIDDPDFWAVTHVNHAYGGHVLKGMSTSSDGMKTWNTNPSLPPDTLVSVPSAPGSGTGPAVNGAVALGNKGNMVWAPSNRCAVCYLKGGEWNPVSLGGNYVVAHSGNLATSVRVLADKSNPGTFYLTPLTPGDAGTYDLAIRGLWKTTDGGDTWARVFSGYLIGAAADQYDLQLKQPYGKAGHIWVSSLDQQADFWNQGLGSNFKMSPDDGAHFYTVPGIQNVSTYCFSRAASGAAYPTVWAAGWVNGVYGIYSGADFDPIKLAAGQSCITWVAEAETSTFVYGNPYYTCSAGDESPGGFRRSYWGTPFGSIYGTYSYTIRAS